MFKNKNLIIILYIYLIFAISMQIGHHIIYYNLINPLFWIIILIFICFYHFKYHTYSEKMKKYNKYAFLWAIIYILSNFYIGIFMGFTKSPFSHNFINILQNISRTIIPLISMELLRYHLLKSLPQNKFNLTIITILLLLFNLNFHTISLITTKKELFEYTCSVIIPLIASNSLATYLSLNFSYFIPLILRIITQLTIFMMPILPQTNWFSTGSIKIIFITLIYLFFNHLLTKEKRILKPQQNSYLILNYALALCFATILICFMLGVFKYKPIAILSNSMSPIFNRGDIVIYKQLNLEEKNNIPLNSIIVYSTEDKYIIHRITTTKNINGIKNYITKGDNNASADLTPVKSEQILGIYTLHLKYLGYPSIWLNELLN